MKALKLFLVLLASIGLVFSLALCTEEDPVDPTPSPTPTPSGICVEGGAADNTGAFCSIGDKLYGYCLFDDADLTEAQIGQLIIELNTFWDVLVEEMSSTDGSFDNAAVKAAFGDVVDFISTDEGVNLVPMLVELLGGVTLCDDGEGAPVITKEGLAEITPYVTELAYSTSGDLWNTISEYSSLLGLTAAQAQTIINAAIAGLNADLALVSHDTIVGILDTWDEAECSAASGGFDSTLPTATSYNTNLIALLEAIDGDGAPADPDFDTMIANLLDVEVNYIIGVVVDLLGTIYTESSDISLIAGLLPTLPGLISGLITSDMDQCN